MFNKCYIQEFREYWDLRNNRPWEIASDGYTRHSQSRKYGPIILTRQGQEDYSTVMRRFKKFKQERGIK